jgi:hypothetical protein
MTGAVMSGVMGGNAGAGAAVALGAGSLIGGKGAAFLSGAGGHIKGAAQTLTTGGSIKDIGQNIMAGSMQKGGALANAGWGLQSAVNKVSSVAGKGEPFAAPSYIKGQKMILGNAHQGMQDLHPQMNMAKTKYDYAKAHFGADSNEAESTKTQYASIKTDYDRHVASAALAQMKMRSYSELKNYAASRSSKGAGASSYTPGRGRV